MSWDDLRYVLAVARRGTLTSAGDELRVTHTTVGRRLRALECAMSVRLFDRTPDGLVPTPAGQELVAAATQMEAELQAARRRIMGRDAELHGALRVSIFDFLLWRCADALESFMRRYPRVDLTITTSLDAVSLARREADVAIRLTDQPPELLLGRRVERAASVASSGSVSEAWTSGDVSAHAPSSARIRAAPKCVARPGRAGDSGRRRRWRTSAPLLTSVGHRGLRAHRCVTRHG